MSSRYSRTIESMTMTETACTEGVHTLTIGNYFPLRYPTANTSLSTLSDDNSTFTKIFIAQYPYSQGDSYTLFGTTLTVTTRKIKIIAGDYVKANINFKDGTIRLVNLSRIEFDPISMVHVKYWRDGNISYDTDNRQEIFNETIYVGEDCDLGISVNVGALIHTLGMVEVRIFADINGVVSTTPLQIIRRSTNIPIETHEIEDAYNVMDYRGVSYMMNGAHVIDDVHKDDVIVIRVDVVNIVDPSCPAVCIPDQTPKTETTTSDDKVLWGITELMVNGHKLTRGNFSYYIDENLEIPIYYTETEDGIELDHIDDGIRASNFENNESQEFIIPDEINGKPVISLADGFMYNTADAIGHVTIGENVTYIGNFFLSNPFMIYNCNIDKVQYPLEVTFGNELTPNVSVGMYVFAWRMIPHVLYIPEAWGIQYPKGWNTFGAIDIAFTSSGSPTGGSYGLTRNRDEVEYGPFAVFDTATDDSSASIYTYTPREQSVTIAGVIRKLTFKPWDTNITAENALYGAVYIIEPDDEYAFGKNIKTLCLHPKHLVIRPLADDPDKDWRNAKVTIPGCARFISMYKLPNTTRNFEPACYGVIDDAVPDATHRNNYFWEFNSFSPNYYGRWLGPCSEYGTKWLSDGNQRLRLMEADYFASDCGANCKYYGRQDNYGYLKFDPVEAEPGETNPRRIMTIPTWIQLHREQEDSNLNYPLVSLHPKYKTSAPDITTMDYTTYGVTGSNYKYNYGYITIPANTTLECNFIKASDIIFEDESAILTPTWASGANWPSHPFHADVSDHERFNPTKYMTLTGESWDTGDPDTNPNNSLPSFRNASATSSGSAMVYGLSRNPEARGGYMLFDYMNNAVGNATDTSHTNECADTPLSERVYRSDALESKLISYTVGSVGRIPHTKILYLQNPGDGNGMKWWNGIYCFARVKVYPITLKSYADSDGLVFDNPLRPYTPVPVNQPLTSADCKYKYTVSTNTLNVWWGFSECQMISSTNVNLNSMYPSSGAPSSSAYNAEAMDNMSGWCIYLPELITDNPDLVLCNVFNQAGMVHPYAVSRRVGFNYINLPAYIGSNSYGTSRWRNTVCITFGLGTERIEKGAVHGGSSIIQIPPTCNFVEAEAVTLWYEAYAYAAVPEGCTVETNAFRRYNSNYQKMPTSGVTAMKVYKYRTTNNMEDAYTYTKDSATMTCTIANVNQNYWQCCETDSYAKTIFKTHIGTLLMPSVTSDGYTVTAIAAPSTSGFFNQYYTRVSEVFVPDTITAIPNNFLRGSRFMCKTNIPASVTSIGDYAYYRTDHMNVMDIQAEHITSVGKYAFMRCGYMLLSLDPTTLTTEKSEPYCFHYLYQNGRGHLRHEHAPFRGAHSFKMTDEITSIGDYAFAYSNVLQGAIKLPENSSFTAVPQRCFLGAGGITEISMRSNITSIGLYAFSAIDTLEKITIPATVTTCNTNFALCYDLTEAHILCPPPTDANVAKNYFAHCESLRKVEIPQFTTLYEQMFIGCSSLFRLDFYGSRIKQYAFRRSNIEELHIYNDCVVEKLAFYEAPNLKRIITHNGAKLTFDVASLNSHLTGYTGQALTNLDGDISILEKMDPDSYRFECLTTSASGYSNTNTCGIPSVDGDFVDKLIAETGTSLIPQSISELWSTSGIKHNPIFYRTCDVFKSVLKQKETYDHTFPESIVISREYAINNCYYVPYSYNTAYYTNDDFIGHNEFMADYNRTCNIELFGLDQYQFAESGFTNITWSEGDNESTSWIAIKNQVIPRYFNTHGIITESQVNRLCSLCTGVGSFAFNHHGDYFEDGVLVEILDADGNDAHLKDLVINSNHAEKASYYIGDAAFAGIYSLETISVTTAAPYINIATMAFGFCPNLESAEFNSPVYISETKSDCGSWAFARCTSLKTVAFNEGFTDATQASYMKGLFDGCDALESITVPTGTSTAITNTFPEGVEIIYI